MSIHRNLLKKDDLANLKSKVYKSNIGKRETTPVDLSKLSEVVKNEVIKKLNILNWLKKLMQFRQLILIN